ncbi:hypothetical protein ACWEPC_05170 [Nonomuraea sp. NPDC004297]
MGRTPTNDLPAGDLAELLQRERSSADVRRADELARARAQAAHQGARADLATETRIGELDRAEREASAKADAELARMYRTALASGERIRIAAGLSRSAEARALRLERLRTLNLTVLVPVLLGFAAWSTTGVQHGAARLMGVTSHDPMWWALWLLEPVLIGAVVWVIIARARLAASGGKLRQSAERIAAGCLATSVLLNLAAAAPTPGQGQNGWMVAGAMVAHAIGPLGAAFIAHLIGVVDASVSTADPWHDEQGERVPHLAEMNLRPSTPPALDSDDVDDRGGDGDAFVSAPEPAPVTAATAWPVSSAGRPLLPLVARPHVTPGKQGRTGGDQDGSAPSRASRPARPAARPNKGSRVPAALRAASDPSPRALSDDDLAQRLTALVDSGQLAADASMRAVQSALGISFDRAKRILGTAPTSPAGDEQERGAA